MSDTISQIGSQVARGMVDALLPFGGDPSRLPTLLQQLGYTATAAPPELGTLADVATPLVNALAAFDVAQADFDAGVGTQAALDSAVQSVFVALGVAIAAVEAIAQVVSSTLPQFDQRLFGFALASVLETDRPVLFAILLLAGVIVRDVVAIDEPKGAPFEIVSRQLILDRVLKWFQDPKGVLADVYGWGTPTIDVGRLYSNLEFVLRLRRLWPTRQLPTTNELTAYGFVVQPDRSNLPPVLGIPLVVDGSTQLILDVVPVGSASPGGPQQLALTLEVTGAIDAKTVIGSGWTLEAKADGDVSTGLGVLLRPQADPRLLRGVLGSGSASDVSASVALTASRAGDPGGTASVADRQRLFALTSGAEVSAQGVSLGLSVATTGGAPEVAFFARVAGGKATVTTGGSDGFLSTVLPQNGFELDFDAGIRWSNKRGVSFEASGGLELDIPVHRDLGPVTLESLKLGFTLSNGLRVAFTANADVTIGPVLVSVDGIGAALDVAFRSGNLGWADADGAFVPPTSLGVEIDAGSVTGGGFLFFDPANSRYGGALELKVYSVNVKAFGVIETKLPNGQSGFSFAVVISAEFTPIQLGLGFTLNGVGGIIGINRRIDQDALAKGVRTGSLEHLLFPHDVVHDAPQIIHDLQTILPPTNGRYVFGPLAKLGWGTPTLIEGELGLILELPGPRLGLLGEVSALLPKKEKALVAINLSVAGLLDFPRKYFSIDASLHNSYVGSYPISGDMAMRLSWGDNPTFALAVGGFNPAFQPPSGFPSLRRVTVDLGTAGSPSLTLQGYFAITSNTAQVGALAKLHASGSGINLDGSIQFDALFVFSPFSFEVDISAQVRITFHGHGIGIHLKGVLQGPSPWHVHGEVCVSILWWDACLRFDKTFGSAQTVAVPQLDPWTGTDPAGGVKEVTGLKDALEDVRNWTPEPPPGSVAVVTYADNTGDNKLIDPLGIAIVKQTVCPFNLQLQRFGAAKPLGAAKFVLRKVNGNDVTNPTYRKEPFAKAQFVELSAAKKLSAPSFEPFDGSIVLPANTNSASGTFATTDLSYTTKVLGADPTTATSQPTPNEHLLAMALRSATGLAGLRRSAAQVYLNPTATARFTFGSEEFVVGNPTNLTTVPGILTGGPANKFEATNALNLHFAANPADKGTLQVYPKYELAGR